MPSSSSAPVSLFLLLHCCCLSVSPPFLTVSLLPRSPSLAAAPQPLALQIQPLISDLGGCLGEEGGLCGFRVGARACVCVCQAVYVGQWWGCRAGEFTISPPQPRVLSSQSIAREKGLGDNNAAAAAAASFAFTLSGSAAHWFKYISPVSRSQLWSAPLG